MDIKNYISILSVLSFIVFILLSKEIRRNYLLYVVFLLPVMDLFITTQPYGGYRVFNFITYITVLLLIGNSEKPIRHTKDLSVYTYLLAALYFLLIVGCLISEFITESLISLSQFVTVTIFCILLVKECLKDSEFKFLLLKGIKFSCLVSLVFLAIQLIFGLAFTLYKLNASAYAYDILIRYPSYFEDPQKYGQFLAICSFLFLIDNPGKKVNSFAHMGLFLAVVIALFLTGVRAAFTGLCAGMVLILFFGELKYKIFGFAGILVAGFVLFFYSSHFAMFNRGAGVNETASVRYMFWRAGWKVFLKYPYLGLGIGNYQHYVSLHSQDQYWSSFGNYEYVDHPESGYLKILSEFGIIGFLIFMSFIILPIVSAVKFLKNGIRENRMLLFLIAGLLSWLVAFATVHSISDLRIFLLIVTLIGIMISFSPNTAGYSEI